MPLPTGPGACAGAEVSPDTEASTAGEGFAGAGGAGATADSVASTTIGIPRETLSPTLTLTSCTTPAASAGTSIDAFSLSRVMSESFFLTRSPGLTSTSITGTSLKSPMSGTRTSMACAGDGAAGAAAGAVAGVSVDVASTTIGIPCE